MKTWFGQFVAKRLCETGRAKKCACDKMFKRAELYASNSQFALVASDGDEEHPNQLPFEGVLVLLDEPSQKPPHGAQGHRIYVPRDAAEKNLSSLVGQGLNYAPSLDEHAPRRKVGVITKAWIDGNKVKVRGWVWKKDFPEAEHALKRPGLGMSMELANVYVRDEHEDVWHLQDFVFTGATVLRKDAAAYSKTALTAAAVGGDGGAMPEATKKKKADQETAAKEPETSRDQVKVLAAAVGESITNALKPFGDRLEALSSDFGEVKELMTIQAAAKAEEFDEADQIAAASEEEDDEEMSAKSEEDDDEEMSAARKSKSEEDDEEDDSDEDDVDAALEDLEDKAPFREPGEVNKGFEKKGSKTSVTKVGASKMLPNPVKSRGLSAAAALAVREIVAARDRKWHKKFELQASAYKKEIKKVRTELRTMDAQLERFAHEESRRSALPIELTNLAAKVNINLHEVKASGEKLTGDQLSAMFSASGYDLDPTQKIAMKMRLEEAGMLDAGVIERPWNARRMN